MLTSRTMERTREALDTFMAAIRPTLTHRSQEDFSYRLTEDAFILFHHLPIADSQLMAPQAFFKAVHVEEPDGWSLYVPDEQGHWLPHADGVFAPSLAEALDVAEALIADLEPPSPMQEAC